MTNLNDLRDLCLKIAEEKGFLYATIGEDLMLMTSELAEALEDHRNGRQPTETWYEHGNTFANKPCGIPSEIADLIIRALHFCGKHGINIDKAVQEKIEFNRTRTHMHGKKL